jgi:transposase
MVDQMLKQTHLGVILEQLIPEMSDTLKALVAYRVLTSTPYYEAETWYEGSYAKIIYPKAKLTSPRISEFHAEIGQERYHRAFFESYFREIIKAQNPDKQDSFSVLIDSTGLQNHIKTYLTAINNHNGVNNNEIKLIFVLDSKTKMPLFYRYIPGNIIDNSTLISTINLLSPYNINVELIVMDCGYSSTDNLSQLLSANIPFITRMSQNRKDFKNLILEYDKALDDPENTIGYRKSTYYGIKTLIKIDKIDVYAYIFRDLVQATIDKNNLTEKYNNNIDRSIKLKEKYPFCGTFVLLSPKEYTTEDILTIYRQRGLIEQVFDDAKTYAGLSSLRVHSEETIRAVLLISFLAIIINNKINLLLQDTNLNIHNAIANMHNLFIKIYDDGIFLEELTKNQKIICSSLNSESPYLVEHGTLLKKESLVDNLRRKNSRRGRLKGSKNKNNSFFAKEQPSKPDGIRARGRPRGNKIKVKPISTKEQPSKPNGIRTRGRPSVSKNNK